MFTIFVKLFVIFFLANGASAKGAITLTSFNVPKEIQIGEDAILKCEFAIEKGAEIYAIKWYKNDEEFFRYLPKDNPKINFYSLNGVKVDVARSNDTTVVLKSVTSAASGMYRCEVSLDAPDFDSEAKEGRLMVVDRDSSGSGIVQLWAESVIVISAIVATLF